MHRRDFLFRLAIASFVGLEVDLSNANFIVKQSEVDLGRVIFSDPFSIYSFDLKSDQIKAIEINMRAHSFTAYPENRDLILTQEKWGKWLAVVDFKSGKVFKKISAEKDFYFYGHSLFSRDNKFFYTILVNHYSGDGFLATFDAERLKLVDQIYLTKGGAHEISAIPNSSILVIAVTGWQPLSTSKTNDFQRIKNSSLVFFDTLTKQTIVEKFLHDPILSFAHVKTSSTGEVFAISDIMSPFWASKTSGRLYKTSLNSDVVTYPISKSNQPVGEFLSLSLNEKLGLVAVTNPFGKQTYIYSMQSPDLITEINTDSKSVEWSTMSQSLLSMRPVKFKSSQKTEFGLRTNFIPNGGLGLSSHMLYQST